MLTPEQAERRRIRHLERILTEPGYVEKVNGYARERGRRLRSDPETRAALQTKDREYRRARRAAEPGWRAETHRQWRGQYPVEAKVERYLVDCVKARRGMCPKFNDPGRRGAPDRLVCLPGHPTYYVELKRPKIGKLDAHQIRYHNDLRAAGQKVWVIWSNEEVDDFFTSL